MPVPPPSPHEHGDQLAPRRRSRRPAADPRSAPTSGVISSRQRSVVLLDAQQVEHQREVERAQGGGGDRAEPGADALRRIVADAFDFDRLGPRARQLLAVGVRDERLVGVRRQQLFRDVVPDRLEPFGAAERRRRDVVLRQREQPLLFARRRGPASGTPAPADRSTCRPRSRACETKREMVPSDIRLTTACISGGPSSSPLLADQAEQHLRRAAADRRRHVASAPARAAPAPSSTPRRRCRAACASGRRS